MASAERIAFITEGADADERLIREYIVPSLARLESIDGCTGVRFSRFGMDPRYDRSEVKLGIYGKPQAVVESEQDRWDDFIGEGLIDSWSHGGIPFEDKPEDVQEFLGRAYVLGSHMAKAYFEEFDARPSFVEEVIDDDGLRYGLWAAIHVLANNIGYSAEEEVDAYELLLRDRLMALTELRGHDLVRERIDELRTELDDLEATVDDLEQQGGYEYYSGPG